MASGSLEKDLANLNLKRVGAPTEGGGGYVVCERKKSQVFILDSSEISFKANETFVKKCKSLIQDWPFRMVVVFRNMPEAIETPELFVILEPMVINKQPKISDIPMIHYQQTNTHEDMFYNFGCPIWARFPQTVNPRSSENIVLTISSIPYVESINGACELSIRLYDFEYQDDEIIYFDHKPRGQPYYLLTSAEGYLVRINVFYITRNFYAHVYFIAGPNDKKLSYHFPHLFYAIVKHKQNVEQNFYAAPVFKNFEKYGEYNITCGYDYFISTYDALTDKGVLIDDKLRVRFCIVPVV